MSSQAEAWWRTQEAGRSRSSLRRGALVARGRRGLPVDDGTFAFTGQVGKVKVAISGTFVDERRARIRLETTGPNCAGARSVEAELS